MAVMADCQKICMPYTYHVRSPKIDMAGFNMKMKIW